MTSEQLPEAQPPGCLPAALFDPPLFCFAEMEEIAPGNEGGLPEEDTGAGFLPDGVRRSHFRQTPAASAASVALIAVRRHRGDHTTLHLQPGPEDAPVPGDIVEIADAEGAPVWSYCLSGRDFPHPRVVWDGRDSNGRPLPAGPYWARLARREITLAATKLIRSR